MMTFRNAAARPSRRDLLGLIGAMGGAALAAGCGGGDEDKEAADKIRVPKSRSKLPTGDVSFRWVDSGDQKAVFFEQFFKEYHDAHQNIEIKYDPLPWEEISKVVPLGVQNGNAHDVFQLPQSMSGLQAVREGWVAALDDIIPDVAKWKRNFPYGVLVEGINMFEGKVYGVPLGSNRRHSTLLLYNEKYMKAAGFDPKSEPLTWDTLRQAARKITKAGKGRYYGFIEGGAQAPRWAEVVSNLAQMAGSGTTLWQGAPFDWRTGEFKLTTDLHREAVELILAMKKDGSIFPDTASMNAPESRAAMPQGLAGMILQGPWNIPIWQKEAPQFAFGVAGQPGPDEGTPVPLSAGPGAGNLYWVFAKSKNKVVAGDMFSYLGSPAGQKAWADVVGVADPPFDASAFDGVKMDARSKAAIDIFKEQVRLRPDPMVRNPEGAKVMLEWKTVTPEFGQTLQGVYAGEVAPAKGLKDAEDRYNKELERAIAAARAKGAEVSREDWVFANWKPAEDYTEKSYDGL